MMNAAKLFKRVILGSCFSLLANTLPLHAADNPTPAIAPLNPAFVKWQQSGGAKTAQQVLTAGGVHATGYIPPPADLSHLANEPVIPANKIILLGAPSSYDLRTINAMTPVKNQGSCGSCWMFATYGSMESWLLKNKNETWDFSEQNMKNTNEFDVPPDPCDGGGNFIMATAYLTRWRGAVDESDDPYNATDYTPHYGLPTPRRDNTVRIFASSDDIKNALQTYGALASSMYWGLGTNYTSSDTTYYYSGSNPPDHAITIAGWDDNKSVTGTSAPGAWLIKNSWGTGWGSNGYFWLSYADAQACKTAYAFTDAVPVDTSASNYYYDPLGWVGQIGFNKDTAWGANIFIPTKKDSLAAVGFYATANNTAYSISIYDSFKVSTGTFYNQLGSTVTGTLTNAGYYTIALPSKIYCASGNNFGVVVKFITPSYNYPVAYESPVTNYSDSASASAGQSYISGNGTVFSDLTGTVPNGNVCIRVLSASSTVPSAPPAPILSSPSNGATNQAASLTLSWNSSTGATSYRLQVSTSPTFSSTVFDQSGIGGTSQAVTLINGTTYYWRVNATNGGGTSAWSTTWSFTTALPAVQFTSASQSKSESGGTMTITAQLSGVSGLPVTVPFTLSGTATQGAGNDYTITASPITIAAGSTTATITITIINDPLPENNETVIVTMGTPTNATLGATTVHTATIIDDDGALTLSSPSNGAGCQAISLTLSWTAITGVSNYQAQVATVSDFSTTFLNQTGITSASQAVNSLANNTTYYWRVRATLNQDT
ncbi:MAG: lectin like domain-containing protein, partial [Chitinispirillaceae bacterium]